MEPGRARLIGTLGGALDAATLEMAILRLDTGTPQHLDPTSETGWIAAERWLRPDGVGIDGEAVTLEVGPHLTWRLQPFKPYVLKFRDGQGRIVEDRLSWAAIRLPSTPPAAPASEPVAEPAVDPLAAFAELAANAEPEPLAPTPEPTPPPPPRETGAGAAPGRRSPLALAALALLLLALVGGGVWGYLQFGGGGEPEVAGVPLTLDGARGFLTREPAPEGAEAAGEGQRFATAGAHDGAFLLFRYAARKGDGDAAYALARYYDPESFRAEAGPVAAADAATALEWYEQAAKAGHVEAMVRAGQLLQAESETRPETALQWYELAANAGHVEAMVRAGELLRAPSATRPDAADAATAWLEKAAAAGSERARALLP
jgi:TPR repeat protein